MLASPELSAFITAALRWSHEPLDEYSRELVSNPYSGVSNEVANALLLASSRGATLLNTISEEPIALPTSDRDSVFDFCRKLNALRACGTRGASKAELVESVVGEFSLPAAADEVLAAANSMTGKSPPASTSHLPLTTAVVPEDTAPLRTRLTHFSASSLNTYVECRRKWFYRYICAAVEDRGSSASFYGSAFHAALEALHQEFPRPSDVSEQLLWSKLQGHLNAAFDRYRRGFETSVEFELQRRRARRTAKRYVDWLCSRATRSPFTVVGCELAAQMDLEGFEFIGYIDRLDLDDSTAAVTVIDYKTGSIAESADEYLQKVRQFREFQLPFYYWARTAAGDRVSRLALVPLKDALLDVAPIELEVVPISSDVQSRRPELQKTGVISIAELERARSKMVAICKELTQGEVHQFAVTEDPSTCRYCPYVSACIFRPAPAEDNFAR
ncbi:MAG: PD-(D/E)XK nuclease family protein [Candidatus Eremiobacteraeota bacterium]|nr:PD-(D/E)XK nuclease family protein [Candidatus Eremiobacteraeota bacterium]